MQPPKCWHIVGCFIFVLAMPMVAPYRILFFALYGSRSHLTVMESVAGELGKRGHQVVIVTSIDSATKLANVTHIQIPESKAILDDDSMNFFRIDKDNFESFLNLKKAVFAVMNVTFANPFVRDVIKNPLIDGRPKFDLVVVDPCFNQFGLVLSYRMSVPSVYLSTTILPPNVAWSMNIPYPTSYVPTGFLNLTGVMSFWERAGNTFNYVVWVNILCGQIYSGLDELIGEYRLTPEVPSIQTMENNVSFVIANDHPSLGASIPTMPYYVQLGGLQLELNSDQKLSKELEVFMQKASKVIYFSLGEYTRGDSMPADMKRKVIEAFSRLPYTVIWKFEKPIDGVPENVKMVPWTQQKALLAHPKLKLFISHGGALSLQEATFLGCPILGFPLIGDQEGNISIAHSYGFGESLNFRTFTAQQLHDTIVKMVEDERYKKNAMRVSEIFKDRPQRPVDTAAYWIEYVIRHKGAAHLKSGAENLNVFQYFMLDVIVLIIAIFLTALATCAWLVLKILKFFAAKFGQRKQKTQ